MYSGIECHKCQNHLEPLGGSRRFAGPEAHWAAWESGGEGLAAPWTFGRRLPHPSFLKYFSSVNIPVYPPLEVTSEFLRESLQRIPKRRVEYNE